MRKVRVDVQTARLMRNHRGSQGERCVVVVRITIPGLEGSFFREATGTEDEELRGAAFERLWNSSDTSICHDLSLRYGPPDVTTRRLRMRSLASASVVARTRSS